MSKGVLQFKGFTIAFDTADYANHDHDEMMYSILNDWFKNNQFTLRLVETENGYHFCLEHVNGTKFGRRFIKKTTMFCMSNMKKNIFDNCIKAQKKMFKFELTDDVEPVKKRKRDKGGCPKCSGPVVHAPQGIPHITHEAFKVCPCGWNTLGIKL